MSQLPTIREVPKKNVCLAVERKRGKMPIQFGDRGVIKRGENRPTSSALQDDVLSRKREAGYGVGRSRRWGPNGGERSEM